MCYKNIRKLIIFSLFFFILISFALIIELSNSYALNDNINIEDELIGYNSDNSDNDNINKIDIDENKFVYFDANNIYKFKISITNKDIQSSYYIEYGTNENNLVKVELTDDYYNINCLEGENSLIVNIYQNDELIQEYNKTIYYIKPYEKQFLDELSNKSIQVHYRPSNTMEEDPIKSLEIVKMLGSQNIRTDIWYALIKTSNGTLDYTYYDNWINYAEKNDIHILLTFNGFYFGTQKQTKINDLEKINVFTNFVKETMERYTYVKKYEILNEPNALGFYENAQDIKDYTNLVKISSKLSASINSDNKIIAGAAIYREEPSQPSLNYFFNKIAENDGYINADAYSYHPYDKNNSTSNSRLINLLNNFNFILNQHGGFTKNYATEYGVIYNSNDIEASNQAKKLIKQSVLMDEYDVDFANLFNLFETENQLDGGDHKLAIVNNDYSPRLSFYSMKNYYQTINGSEYIGKLNWNGLDTYVYDKDGIPVIILWSSNSDTISVNGNDFIAYDLYGNEITNTGEIEISNSPIYLKVKENQSKYFKEAIINNFLKNYDNLLTNQSEFLEKNGSVILENVGSNNENKELSLYLKNITDYIKSHDSNYSYTEAVSLMNKYAEIGTKVIDLNNKGMINANDREISSFLDSLDDILDSIEDYITVTASENNANLNDTKNTIDSVDNAIFYSKKILNTANDLYDKAIYINSLDEENDIKDGLVVSYNMHANILANWAKLFINLKLDENLNIDDNNTIYNVKFDTEYTDVLNNMSTNGTINLVLLNDVEINLTSKVKTNDTIKFQLSGGKNVEYKISVLGDVTGSGDINIEDIAKLYQNVKGKITLNDIELLAGDVTYDGDIDISDVAKSYQYLKGKITEL